MRDPEPYGHGIGELPEDYRNIYGGFQVSAPRALRSPAGRFPLGPGVGIGRQRATTRSMVVQPDQQRDSVDYWMDRLEERLRRVKLTAGDPPWIAPPAPTFLLPIDTWTDSVVTLTAAGGFETVLTFTVPDQHYCRISKFGQWIEAEELASSVSWAIGINNDGAPGIGATGTGGGTSALGKIYDDFNQIIGTIGNPGDIFLTAEPNDVVTVFASNALAVDNIEVKARLVGWAFRSKFFTDASCAWSTPQ